MVRSTTAPSGLRMEHDAPTARSSGTPKAVPRPVRRTFTFFEASLVIGISMMILALVFAEISRFRTGSQRRACIMNLKQIEAAKNLWALVNKKADNKSPAEAQLIPYLSAETLPDCPSGGVYTIRKVSQVTRCSLRKQKDHKL